MGSIGGKASGSLQLLACFFQRSFGALALGPIFGRVLREFFTGTDKSAGSEMARR